MLEGGEGVEGMGGGGWGWGGRRKRERGVYRHVENYQLATSSTCTMY